MLQQYSLTKHQVTPLLHLMEPIAAPTGDSRHTLPEAEASTKHASPAVAGDAGPASPVSTHCIDTIGLWSAQALNLHYDGEGKEVSQLRKADRKSVV